MTHRITLNLLKPRNPLVVLARGRHAGVHQRSASAKRQAQRRDMTRQIARELAHERHRSP